MTLRIKTLTAVAALTLGAAAWAQDNDDSNAVVPEAPAAEATPDAASGTAGGGADAVAVTVRDIDPDEEAAEEPAAEVAETPTAAEPISDADAQAADTPEAPAEDSGATEAAEEPATEAPTEEAASEELTTEDTATDTAEEPAAEAPASPETETAEEAASAEAAATEESVTEEEAPADEAAADAAEEDASAAEMGGEEASATEAESEAAAATEEEAATEEAAEETPAEAEAAEDEGEAAAEEGEADEAAGAEEDAADEDAEGEEAAAEEEEAHVTDIAFSFEGPFGKFDQFQLQRGLQVYTEVCSACHGLRQVPIRALSDEGGPELPEDQVRAYAEQMFIMDAETGEERPRIPTDHFPTVTGMGMGPDLSLMAKARAGFHGPYGTGLSQLFNGMGGPEYIYSVLAHYTGEEVEQAGTLLYGNEAFSGGLISMPPPLFDDLVTYEDGTPATVDQMARDVSAFLMWTAEPHMMARKANGFVGVIFLVILASLLYLTNKRLWWKVKHGDDRE